MNKSLIAFYSRADENYIKGQIKVLEVGNTEVVARIIEENTSATIFKIEQQVPYSKEYNECIREAQNDQKNNARPKLKAYLDSIDEYDVVYLGFPNYWSTMPMAVFTFLEKYDFTGKIIKPFCTHEGSGFGNSLNDIRKLCPNALIKNGLAVFGCNVTSANDYIKNWLKEE
ncbi:MAG: flavodoxin [Anaeroplasmataceae bacterium]